MELHVWSMVIRRYWKYRNDYCRRLEYIDFHGASGGRSYRGENICFICGFSVCNWNSTGNTLHFLCISCLQKRKKNDPIGFFYFYYLVTFFLFDYFIFNCIHARSSKYYASNFPINRYRNSAWLYNAAMFVSFTNYWHLTTHFYSNHHPTNGIMVG